MRKLATIRKITAIDPIPDAGAIEVASVDGWKVVIRKGEFTIDEIVVFCEIDSWIPHELAPFLSKGQEPKEYGGVAGNRLRTIKLRGQLSQGLLLPVSSVIQDDVNGVNYPFIEGSDVTELLGIQKWEAPIPAQLSGEIRGTFPSLIPKTDQERVQSLTHELKEWGGLEFEVTEKLDGSSCTMYLDLDGIFHVCSRNLDLKPSETNSFWQIAKKYNVEAHLNGLNGFKNVAIQGELVGPGIQDNPYKLKEIDFFVFDIYDARTGTYFPSKLRRETCNIFGLKHVPVLSDNHSGIKLSPITVQDYLSLAEGKSVLNPKTEREGLVFKCISNPRIHFKAVSNKFLLKGGN